MAAYATLFSFRYLFPVLRIQSAILYSQTCVLKVLSSLSSFAIAASCLKERSSFLFLAAVLLSYLARSCVAFLLTGLSTCANTVGTKSGDKGSSRFAPEMKCALQIHVFSLGVQFFSVYCCNPPCSPVRIFRETIETQTVAFVISICAPDSATALSHDDTFVKGTRARATVQFLPLKHGGRLSHVVL